MKSPHKSYKKHTDSGMKKKGFGSGLFKVHSVVYLFLDIL